MPLEPSQDAADPLVSRPHRVPTPVVLAGVAGACLLGAGLGLWARPSEHEGPLAHRQRPAPPAATPQRIEIRVDGAGTGPPPPPALARPVEASAPAPPAPASPPRELLAPKRPPEGLMRVHAVAPTRLAEAPRPSPRLPAPADLAVRAAAAKAAKVEKARIAAAAQAKAREKAQLKLVAKKAAAQAAVAQAHKTRLAQEKAARQAKAQAASIRLAQERRKAEAKPPRRARCDSPDPGAALACADPALNAADRQLDRAYRQARAAGVPEDRLARQQQRWLTARANAARQAPWAVHDIYLARIAELQDQTRAASEGE